MKNATFSWKTMYRFAPLESEARGIRTTFYGTYVYFLLQVYENEKT